MPKSSLQNITDLEYSLDLCTGSPHMKHLMALLRCPCFSWSTKSVASTLFCFLEDEIVVIP